MHTIPISFCSGIAHHIADDIAKEDILRDVSDRLRVRTMIRDAKIYVPDSGLDTSGSYVVHLQSRGNPYLLFLNRVGFCETAMYIDRKVRTGYNLPRIIIDHVMFEPDIFSGTVISGEMVRTNDDEWIFLAEDLLAIKGTPIGRVPFRDRYAALLQVAASNRADGASTHRIVVKKMFEADCEGLACLQSHAGAVPYACTGYVFRSLVPGKRNWFVRSEKNMPSISSVAKPMKIRSSVTPDAYGVIDPDSGKDCGVLGVPGATVSRELREALSSSDSTKTWMCRWSPEFEKWIALEGGNCPAVQKAG